MYLEVNMHINIYLYLYFFWTGIVLVYFIKSGANKSVEFTVHSLVGNLCQTNCL